MNSPGSYVVTGSPSNFKVTIHQTHRLLLSHCMSVCVSSSLSHHCSFCQLQGSQWVHEGGCCTAVYLANFCLYKLESPCLCVQDLFAYCFHEGFHSYFMFKPWNWISSRFQSDQICNRGVDRYDWHDNPATNQNRLPLSAYLTAIQPQTPIARIVYTQQPCQSQE